MDCHFDILRKNKGASNPPFFVPQEGHLKVFNLRLGQYTRGIREKFSDDKGFSTDRMIFKDDELSYALGKQGSTRKKSLGTAASYG